MNAQPYNVSLPQSGTPVVEKWNVSKFYPQIHFHKEFQITMIQEGSGHLFVSDKVVPYEKGDVYFFGRDLPHALKTSDTSGTNVHMGSKAISLFFDQDKVKESLRNVPEAYRINKLLDSSHYGIKVNRDSALYLANYIQELTSSSGLNRFLLFLKLLNEASRDNNVTVLSSKAAPSKIGVEDDPKIAKICAYVKENYRDLITLSTIADLAHMSPTGFCRFFKAKTKKTFSQYLTEVRIGSACELLHNEDYSISDCGYGSGFNNLSNFHKHFKKYTGMSPMEYRSNFNN